MFRLTQELSIVEDYHERTRSPFNDIQKEARDYAKSLFKSYPATEDTDPSEVAEWASEQEIEMYETLSLMKANHLLMSISMLYHIWEQQLIRFTLREMEHYFDFTKKVMEYKEAQKIFEVHGIKFTELGCWPKMKELKLLTNTIKHGDGISAERLRKLRPDFFKTDFLEDSDILELHGAVLLDSLYQYVQAAKAFWEGMPERSFADVDTLVEELSK